MSSFRVIIPKAVQKELDKLPEKDWQRIVRQIAKLQDNPRPAGCIKLRSSSNEYRIRIGDYRVRYEVRADENIIVILHCLHRKDVYRV
jgi:mRNA interferase RelE/StbE